MVSLIKQNNILIVKGKWATLWTSWDYSLYIAKDSFYVSFLVQNTHAPDHIVTYFLNEIRPNQLLSIKYYVQTLMKQMKPIQFTNYKCLSLKVFTKSFRMKAFMMNQTRVVYFPTLELLSRGSSKTYYGQTITKLIARIQLVTSKHIFTGNLFKEYRTHFEI